MNEDRELLELAALAAGIAPVLRFQDGGLIIGPRSRQRFWSPLFDDGDALRLLVKLSQMDGGAALMLNSRLNQRGIAQCYTSDQVVAPQEYIGDDPAASIRCAVVRAAAEVGKKMKEQDK